MTSPKMIEAFEVFGRLKDYMDPGFPGRDWNVATGMIIEGSAAMQFMGDWADSCATSSMDEFVSSAASNELVPSVAHGMAAFSSVSGAMSDVVTNFFNSDNVSAEAAAKDFAAQVTAMKLEL